MGRLYPNGERHLRERSRLARLYPSQLLAQTLHIAQRCSFNLRELRYEYPQELVPAGETPATWLRKLVEQGVLYRWPRGATPQVREIIERELTLIAQLGYEAYFLTVHDIVAFANERGILAQGRGSAANSLVCYCLRITALGRHLESLDSLLMERFIFARTRRAAGHRHRLRTRPARGSHPIPVPQVWPRTGGTRGHRHQLSRPQRPA